MHTTATTSNRAWLFFMLALKWGLDTIAQVCYFDSDGSMLGYRTLALPLIAITYLGVAIGE